MNSRKGADPEKDDTPTYTSLRRATRSMGGAEGDSSSESPTYAELVSAGFHPPTYSTATKRGMSWYEKAGASASASDLAEESDAKPSPSESAVPKRGLGSSPKRRKGETSDMEPSPSVAKTVKDSTSREQESRKRESDGKYALEVASKRPSSSTSTETSTVESYEKQMSIRKWGNSGEKLGHRQPKAKQSSHAKAPSLSLNEDSARNDEHNLVDDQPPPLQLHHRLFTMSDHPTKKIVRVGVKKRRSSPDEDCVTQKRDRPGKSVANRQEVTGHFAIRGSITHVVLQKLGRLDSRYLLDDPFDSPGHSETDDQGPSIASMEEASVPDNAGAHDTIVNDNKPESVEPSDGAMASDAAEAATHDASSCLADSPATIGATDEQSKLPPAKLRLCFRSSVMPQKSRKTPNECHRVVILHGPNEGQTGRFSCS
jgi:hypothetical protein